MFGQTWKTNLLIHAEGMLEEMRVGFIEDYQKQGVKYLSELLTDAEEVLNTLAQHDITPIEGLELTQIITILELNIMGMEFYMDIVNAPSPTPAYFKKRDKTSAINLLSKLRGMLSDYYRIAHQEHKLQQAGNIKASRCGTA